MFGYPSIHHTAPALVEGRIRTDKLSIMVNKLLVIFHFRALKECKEARVKREFVDLLDQEAHQVFLELMDLMEERYFQ